jgi:chromosome segregation ATPase
MKTLAAFVVVIVLLLAGLRAQQWRKSVQSSAEQRCAELQSKLDATEARYLGYWPRYERMEEALELSSNALARVSAELTSERSVTGPLRSQIEQLSAARVVQVAKETELKRALDTAVSEAEQLKGSVEDVRSRQTAAEERRKALEDTVKTLEEGVRSRDSDLAQLREKHDKLTAEFNRLKEANRAVTELQNQLAAAKTERDEAVAARAKAEAQLQAQSVPVAPAAPAPAP